MRSTLARLATAALTALALNGRAYSESPPGTASVQIVNATSVPAISLKINDSLVYGTFPQGKKSADAPVRVLEAVYEAEDKRTGSRARSETIIYEPGAYQSLVVLGDFSTPAPPQSGNPAGENASVPNVRFQVFSHQATKPPVRLRIINGMPGKTLKFAGGALELVIKAGDHAILENQPAIAQYAATVDGASIPVLMRQEGLIRNALIVFYLKEGKPAFMRAFENNVDSNRTRAEMEKARN
jgi:hypothetical protein